MGETGCDGVGMAAMVAENAELAGRVGGFED